MPGWQKKSFSEFLKLDDSGVSAYTMDQIKTKSAILGLTDSLTTQGVALAKDADLSAKAATGKLTFRKAIEENKDSILDIGKALEKSDNLSDVWKQSLAKAAEKGTDEYKTEVEKIININKDVGNSIIDLGTSVPQSTGFLEGLKTSFTGIVASLKPMIPLLTTVGVAIAAYEGFKFLDDKFTLTFKTAQKHLEESSSAYANTVSELENLNSQTDNYKSTLESLSSKYEIEFSGIETINEMIEKLRSVDGGLDIADDATISKLERENSLLETRKDLLVSTADTQQKQVAEDARKSIDFASETSMDTRIDRNGMDVSKSINRKDYVREQIAEMEKAQKQIEDAQDKLSNKSLSKKDRKLYEKQFNQATENFEKYKSLATEKLSELNEEAENFYDKQTGLVLKGYEDDVKEINTLNDLVTNFDLSPAEKHLSQIESYFDGSKVSNNLKNTIKQMLETGEVESATDALHKMGVTLNDLGITGAGKKAAFDNYFDSLVSSAKEAQDAINSIDGSVEGVKAAFESENKDADWNSMSDFLNQANELYKNGKIGTDDFKSAAQFISRDLIDPESTKYDADAYVAAWEAAYDKVQRYFDSENPAQSVANFTNDIVNAGLATDDNGDITWQFKNSAEAAKALGLSVEATEVAMRNLEAYGAEFDDVMFSGEGLKRYESALENIKSLRDSMDEGTSKERLSKRIEGWESELEGYQNDLSTLTEDQIVHIEFEYDLASVQQQIDDIRNSMSDSGGSTEEYASLISMQKKKRDMLAGQDNMSDAIADIGYTESLTAFDNFAQRLITEYDSLGEAGRRSIQKQQSALLDLQNSYLDMFQSGDVTDWESFLNTESANEIIEKLAKDMGVSFEDAKKGLDDAVKLDVDADTSKAKSKIDGVISNDGKTITMTVDATTDQIKAQLDKLQKGQKLVFTAEVDGEKTGIEAVKNVDGTITYTANVDGAQVPVSVTEKDGVVTFSADTKSVDAETAKTDGGTRVTKYRADTSLLPSSFSSITRTVNYVANVSAVTSGAADAASAISAIGGMVKHSEGTLLSPAHVNGTAYNMLNMKPAYACGKVSLSRDEDALVNELGRESLIRDGVWSLLPGKMHIESLKKGDIILNAKQTKDLLNTGKTNSHARAYASGTLLNSYANGFRIPTGVVNNSSYSSTLNTSKTTSSANNASNAVSSAASATSDALDALSNYFDWVAVNMSRAARLSEIAENAIDNAIGLSAKQANTADAIRKVQSEIDIARRGADRYLSHANWYASQSGLSADLQTRVQNGTIDISKYDDDTQKKITEYQSWYEKYLDAFDKVTELQEKENELAIKRLENIENFYKLVVNVHESLQNANDAALELNDSLGFSAVSDTVKKFIQSSITEAESIYEQKLQQLTDYENEFNSLMSQGYIKEGSDQYYEAKAQLNEFKQSVYEAEVSLIEFSDKLREVEYTKIQQLIDGFERAVDKLDARIDLMKSRDETVPESIYQKQLDANNAHISSNKRMRDAKLEEQALYAVTSERYQELAEEINKLDTETLGLMKDNEKLKDTIFELRFTPLEDGIKKIESLKSELKDFMNLLNEDAYFDKQGKITADGVAALALLEQSMYSAKQQIADYREGLDKLQESFDNGVISEVEFNEKSEEYRKGIRDSIADVQDYSEALTDLYLNQMKQENEYLQKIIDKRKEALKAKAEYYDYDKKLRSQSKDVNMLKAQIAALEGVNNASAQAELKRLRQQLADAEDELSETKRDHAIDMQEKGYDTMSDELNEILENTEYEIVHNADKQQSVIQSMLQNVVSMYSSAYGKINEIIHNTGWVGSTDFNSNQSNLSTQESAGNQVSNATQHQSNVNSTGTAQSTVTSPIPNNDSFNQKFEQEIYQDPNVDNRPVAELKVSKSSVTLEEGKSTSVSVQIRPTDAKNKTLAWKSSDEKTATVSNGTIKAIKPGSCQITVSTTDGSGISATIGVTVTKKPDPPKPVVNTQTNSSTGGGDGVPRVGDVVTLLAGQRYYYSSWGTSPAGNRYAGVPGGVVIDAYSGTEYGGQSSNHGGYGIHIRSADGVYGDLGWVSLDQITGYNKGTKRVPKDGLALIDDTADGKAAPGSEVLMTKYGALMQLNAGDRVFSNDQANTLWELSKADLSPADYYMRYAVPNYTPSFEPVNHTQNVEIHFDHMVHISDSTITKDSVAEMKGVIKNSIPMIRKEVTDYLYKEGRKIGMRR